MKVACDICEKVVSTDDIAYTNFADIEIKHLNPYCENLHWKICYECTKKMINYLDRKNIASA